MSSHRAFGSYIATARDDVKRPAVQWAVHLSVFKPTRAQRTAPVRAIVINRVETSVHIEEREAMPGDLDGTSLAG